MYGGFISGFIQRATIDKGFIDRVSSGLGLWGFKAFRVTEGSYKGFVNKGSKGFINRGSLDLGFSF